MTLDEAIKHVEEVAETEEQKVRVLNGDFYKSRRNECIECAKEHRQLAEWLRELKAHREIHDILLQLLVDSGLDVCCDDLMDNEEEQKTCEEYCVFQSRGCWVRWAKMKAKEKCKDADSN